MPAGHEGTGEYGGMDALMAAITGTPLLPDAHDDPAFLAEHRSAEADMAVLKEELTWLAEALTGEPRTERATRGTAGAEERGQAAPETAAAGADRAGSGEAVSAAGAVRGGAGEATASAPDADRAGSEGAVSAPDADRAGSDGARVSGPGADRAASQGGGSGAGDERAGVEAAASAAGAARGGVEVAAMSVLGGGRVADRPRSVRRPGGVGRPVRAGGVRRGVRVVLGSVAGVVAFGLVAGLGWVVVRSGGGDSMSSDKSADAKSEADAPARAAGGPALSCYRLLAEGTVARVDRRTHAPRIRVVLTVARSYRPAHGPSEVAFLLGDAASPAPHQGQHVLAGVGRSGQEVTLWAVGDIRVAAERARLTGTAPESAHTQCDEP